MRLSLHLFLSPSPVEKTALRLKYICELPTRGDPEMAVSVSPLSLPALLEKQTKCCQEQCGLRQRPSQFRGSWVGQGLREAASGRGLFEHIASAAAPSGTERQKAPVHSAYPEGCPCRTGFFPCGYLLLPMCLRSNVRG